MTTTYKPATLKLYGVTIPAHDYCLLQPLARMLADQSPSDLPLRKAQRIAVRVAIDAVERMRREAREA